MEPIRKQRRKPVLETQSYTPKELEDMAQQYLGTMPRTKRPEVETVSDPAWFDDDGGFAARTATQDDYFPISQADFSAIMTVVEATLDSLSENQRTAFELMVFNGMGSPTAGRIMGKDHKSVWRWRNQALVAVQEALLNGWTGALVRHLLPTDVQNAEPTETIEFPGLARLLGLQAPEEGDAA